MNELEIAFSSLMGENGFTFIKEINETGMLKQSSYNTICDNISFNGRDSIVKYFGLVHYYYLQGKKK